ncbi:hypothetical protein BLNAU_16659 [Blattamonas nauphoetae]|uniref:Cyclin N-terminal domain-containing protein n=1 Tax=Blattamonas nauphoetae TaxID=2049346 RepID=A0ABQ9XAI7_9EUKA|nr:hypothetical protein BLNAU_16659 [Blattamonas nauphoetae]
MHFTQAVARYLDSFCVPDPPKQQFAGGVFRTEPYNVSLSHWIYQIYKLSKISPSGIFQTCILLVTIHHSFPSLHFSNLNVRRLFLIAAMVVSKMYEDVTYCNRDWIVISQNSFTLKQINSMELELLRLLNFRVVVSIEEYQSFLGNLLRFFDVRLPIALPPSNHLTCPYIDKTTHDPSGSIQFYVPNEANL